MSRDKHVEIRVAPSWALVLFVVFLVLKLTEVIDWSWWWVTSPLWIPVALALAILVSVGLIFLIALPFERRQQRRRDQSRRMRHPGPTQNR